jgi:hypothetical protein
MGEPLPLLVCMSSISILEVARSVADGIMDQMLRTRLRRKITLKILSVCWIQSVGLPDGEKRGAYIITTVTANEPFAMRQ